MKNDNNETVKAEIKELINKEDEKFDATVDESVRNENRKLYALVFIIVFGILSILLVGCMVSIYNAAASVNKYFGYAVGIALLIALFLLLGIPSIKIFFLPYYSIGKDGKPSAVRRANNNRIVKKVSENIVAYHGKSQGGYVSRENVDKLASVLYKGKTVDVHNALKEVYDTDVSKKVRSIILKSACRSFCYTAISQNDKIDAISVLFINIRMIKSILYAYGTRPSMYKLIKIYFKVIIGSLVAYGMQNVSVSNILTKFVKATANMVPAIGVLIDSAVQGATSAILTMIIGYKTKAYVYGEFNMALQYEYDYVKAQIADKDLAQAIAEYNQSKDVLQEKAQLARKGVEESKNKTAEIVTMTQAETAPDLTRTQKLALEEVEKKEKASADSDLALLFDTGSKLLDNAKRKKQLKGEVKQKSKGKLSWTLNKRTKEGGEVAADVAAPIEPEDQLLPEVIKKDKK